MNAEVGLTLACIAQTVVTALALRSLSAVHRRGMNGIMSKSVQEYAMLEKMSERPEKKRSKTPPTIPYGL